MNRVVASDEWCSDSEENEQHDNARPEPGAWIAS